MSRDSGHAPFNPLLTFRGWWPPRNVMNRYNWSTDNITEASVSTFNPTIKKVLCRGQFGVKWGKNRGYLY